MTEDEKVEAGYSSSDSIDYSSDEESESEQSLDALVDKWEDDLFDDISHEDAIKLGLSNVRVNHKGKWVRLKAIDTKWEADHGITRQDWTNLLVERIRYAILYFSGAVGTLFSSVIGVNNSSLVHDHALWLERKSQEEKGEEVSE